MMPTIGQFFPAITGATSGEGSTVALPNVPDPNGETFHRVMSRTLSPNKSSAPSTPSSLRKNHPSTQSKPTNGSNPSPTATRAVEDPATEVTTSSDKVKTTGEPKLNDPGSQEPNVPVQNGTSGALDPSQQLPIQLLAPTLAACLLKSFAPAMASTSANNGPISVAGTPAVTSGKTPVVAAAFIPSTGAKAKQSSAEVVSQLLTGATPKPVSSKSSGVEKIPEVTTSAETAVASAIPLKTSYPVANPEVAPRNIASVPTPDLPADNSGNIITPQKNAGESALAATSMSHGTSVAKQAVPMNKVEQTNKVAGPVEKVLPIAAIPVARGNTLPGRASSASAPAPAGLPETNVTTGSTLLENTANPSVSVAEGVTVSSFSDVRSQTLDRTHDLMALHATRLVGMNSDSLQVVIKPDAGTQLSLELRQRGNGIEAQAVLQKGDLENLKQHWPELQQRMAERGIKLAPLTGDGNTASWTGSQKFNQQPNQPAEREPLWTGANPGFVPAGTKNNLPDEPVIPVTSSRGWQTWA